MTATADILPSTPDPDEGLRQQLHRLEDDLHREFGASFSADVIDDVVEAALRRLEDARVQQYLPVLVGRAARADLRRRRAPLVDLTDVAGGTEPLDG